MHKKSISSSLRREYFYNQNDQDMNSPIQFYHLYFQRIFKWVVVIVTLLISISRGYTQPNRVQLPGTLSFWYFSQQVQDSFLIQLYLPPQNGDLPADSVPLLVVLDGDRNFGLAYDIVRWLNWSKEIPPIAVLGIAYGKGQAEWWSKRSRDFTYSEDQTKTWGNWPLAGGGARFQAFLANELFPYFVRQYPSITGSRTLAGLSFGGLFGANVLLSQPDLFQNYLLLGPALIWNNQEIFRIENTFAKHHDALAVKIYTAVGTADHLNIIEPWSSFFDQLSKRNYDGLKIYREKLSGESHISMLPAGLTRGLKFLLNQPN